MKKIKKEWKFDKTQESAIIGSLLGDGCVTSNCTFVKSHKLAHSEYLYYLYELLLPYSRCFSERVAKDGYGAGKKYVRFHTLKNGYFVKLREKWYPNNIKIIPQDLKLNPEILAWWFCDDGTNSWKLRRANIYTQCFTKEENDLLVEKLKEIGVQSYVGKTYDNTGSGYCIDISKDGYFDLIDMITPIVSRWNCMKYKIDVHGARKGLRSNNKTGVKGVYWDKGRKKWAACIKINNKTVGLGRYTIFEEAVEVRKIAELNRENT